MKKSEGRLKKRNLQVKLDDEHDFALELISRQNDGQKFTAIVERAIITGAQAEAAKLGLQWENIWSEDEGMRTLTLWALPGYKANTQEKALRNFTLHHRDFFYADEACQVPHRTYLLHLWPDIEKYYRTWLDRRQDDHWAAADAMAAALKSKKVKPPRYGDDK
jgi:hypothetical protein